MHVPAKTHNPSARRPSCGNHVSHGKSENCLTLEGNRTTISFVLVGPGLTRRRVGRSGTDSEVKLENPLTDPSPMGRFPQGPVHPAGPLLFNPAPILRMPESRLPDAGGRTYSAGGERTEPPKPAELALPIPHSAAARATRILLTGKTRVAPGTFPRSPKRYRPLARRYFLAPHSCPGNGSTSPAASPSGHFAFTRTPSSECRMRT